MSDSDTIALTLDEIRAFPLGSVLRCTYQGETYVGEKIEEEHDGRRFRSFSAPWGSKGVPHFGMEGTAFTVATVEDLREYAAAGFDMGPARWSLGEGGMSHPAEFIPAPIARAGSITATPRGTFHYRFMVLDVQPLIEHRSWTSANLGVLQIPLRGWKFLVARREGALYYESQGEDPGPVWVDGRGQPIGEGCNPL